jgi:hypothetical protein
MPKSSPRMVVSRRRQCRAACEHAIFRREDGQCAVADQLDYVTAVGVDRR